MEQEIDLAALAYGGDAIGRLPDGRAVFVPFALPGERVRARIVEQKRGFARAELLEVLHPSPQRITPRCKHFSICGGCHYQNLPYQEQLIAKREILIDQLRRIGKIENPPVKEMSASPDAWNYRNHVQFHLTQSGRLGFMNVRGNSVVPITECHMPQKGINAFWPNLHFEPNMGFERVSVRQGEDEELMLILESSVPEPPEIDIEADISVLHVYAEHAVVIAGRDHFPVSILGREFRVSGMSFFQVNAKMAEQMVVHLLANLPVTESSILLDVYCGVGLFSKFLASGCRQVVGIESSESSCIDFSFNLDEFNNVDLYMGPAEEVVPYLDLKAESVILDPPRAGLEKSVLDGILKLNPRMIAYVSCDPSTLARDAAHLIRAGYRLNEVTPFDLFPQTYHIESISLFGK